MRSFPPPGSSVLEGAKTNTKTKDNSSVAAVPHASCVQSSESIDSDLTLTQFLNKGTGAGPKRQRTPEPQRAAVTEIPETPSGNSSEDM